MIRKAAKHIADIVAHVDRDGETRVDQWDSDALRLAAQHLDPTVEQLATDAGECVARLFGSHGDIMHMRLLVARARDILETRQWEQCPRDWAIVAFFDGRLGADWAKAEG